MTPLEQQKGVNAALWTRYSELGDQVRTSTLDLIQAIVLNTFPTATQVEVTTDGDSDGSWLSLVGVWLVGADDVLDLTEDHEELEEELSSLIRDLFEWWVETDRYGQGYIDLTHPFEPDPEGFHGPDRCRHDGLPAENGRHQSSSE